MFAEIIIKYTILSNNIYAKKNLIFQNINWEESSCLTISETFCGLLVDRNYAKKNHLNAFEEYHSMMKIYILIN